VRRDLWSREELIASLAFVAVGTFATRKLIEPIYQDIASIAIFNKGRPTKYIRKKALLCLLRIFRRYKDIFTEQGSWATHLNKMLNERSLSMLNATTSLLVGLTNLGDASKF